MRINNLFHVNVNYGDIDDALLYLINGTHVWNWDL